MIKLSNVTFCDSIFSKFRGQMFRFRPLSMVFRFDKEQKVPLHMWFVFFPIDVKFLDSSCKVIEIKNNFKPFSFYSPKSKAKYVVELPVGSVSKMKISIGSEFIFS